MTLLLVGLARGDSDSTSAAGLAWGKTAMEFVAAAAVGTVCYVPGMAAGWLAASAAAGHWTDIETNEGFGYIAAGVMTGVALGCAGGACLAGGSYPGRHGKFLGALAGAAVGAAVGAPVFYVAGAYGRNPFDWYLGLGAFGVLSAAGAVAGYNLSRPSKPAARAEHFLILPPSLSFAPEHGSSARRSPAIRAQLLNVRL
jgi:hypothetical protein